MRKEQWVVTFRFETDTGFTLMEFYRGLESECRRIAARSSLGEDDRQRTIQPWKAIIGKACDWDTFLRMSQNFPGIESVIVEAV